MPTWFRNRPSELADPTEQQIAEILDRLEGDWKIRWGYYYKDGKTTREGDFVIQGPKGQILVMEVKGSQNRQFLLTGRWEGSEDGDNPLEQLNSEWNAILDKVKDAAGSDERPWVGKALCMPNLNRTGIERFAKQFEDVDLITGKDLDKFEGWWKSHLESKQNRCKNPAKVFQAAVVPHMKPAALNLFIKETDRLFDRYRSTESEILEMLAENKQWIVEGGPGTGKTFLALQRAQQLAEGGASGCRVLFLCYNLILAAQITELAGKLELARGEIVVKSWEALVQDILASMGMRLEVPDDAEEKMKYFTEEIPDYVCTILREDPPSPPFDALVIDEAQDHDTSFSGKQEDHPLGWWSWYFAQLKEGLDAPMALFLDLAQRPRFRGEEKFSLDYLKQTLPLYTHLRLRRVLRYTRQVHAYLAGLPFPIAREFTNLALPADSLPEGPEVIEKAASKEDLSKAIEDILQEWIGGKLCKVDDIVVMGFNSTLNGSRSLLGIQEIGGYRLADYEKDGPRGQLQYIGIHRAKGMDFLGVILIDMKGPEVLAEENDTDRQETYFYGATRARQMLGIISYNAETGL